MKKQKQKKQTIQKIDLLNTRYLEGKISHKEWMQKHKALSSS